MNSSSLAHAYGLWTARSSSSKKLALAQPLMAKRISSCNGRPISSNPMAAVAGPAVSIVYMVESRTGGGSEIWLIGGHLEEDACYTNSWFEEISFLQVYFISYTHRNHRNILPEDPIPVYLTMGPVWFEKAVDLL